MAAKSLQELLETEAIRELKALYCILVDARDWERCRQLFTPDARIGGELPLKGEPPGRTYRADEFVAAAARTLAGWTTLHTVHASLIETTGDATARGLWAYSQRGYGYTGGYYDEQYVKGSEGWKIASMQFTLIHPPAEDQPHATRTSRTDAQWQALAARWVPPSART
jgi:hypothetical protein